MTIKEIYNLAIKMGLEADLRGRESVEKFLRRKRAKYDRLTYQEREDFDKEALENPYLDSRLLNIFEDKAIKKVMAGIDIDPAEVLLAKGLGDIDLIIAHHPRGMALASLHDVMEMQCEILGLYGVPVNVAEGLMKPKIAEVARGISGANHQRAVDAARMAKVNFINIHTPLDNLAARFLKNKIEEKNPERAEDLLNFLKEIPEYKEAIKIGAGPEIFVGSPENRCGRVAVTEITGGAEGSPKLYEKMANAGIGTVVSMHQSEEHRKEAEAANINVVIAGHMSSDSLGMNLFLDEIENQGIEIVPCSGLIRVKRH